MFSASKLILLGLLSVSASLVGAIDIYLYDAQHSCSGAAFVCTNVNPNQCCGNDSNDHHSLAFRAKPREWNLEVRGHSNGNCRDLTLRGQSGTGSTDTCLTFSNPNSQPIGSFSGAGYSFWNRRRTTAEGLSNCHTESPTCGGLQRPDRLDLADGTKYNITGLTDAERLELRSAVTTKVTAAEIPTKFDHFKI
ncbi:hypothetical protein VTL71DRAFT_9797 [Oculimacula yallundae]|uniref:Secreted protein n=1 Tax=Oculimacula yallundae TaxID=86028 RepID=A0ABR4BQI8_9HELO